MKLGKTNVTGEGITITMEEREGAPLRAPRIGSMERTIRDWQYVDRLTGLYEEMGVSINREPYGPLTGTLVPPCISHAAAIIEALLAAEQGVTESRKASDQMKWVGLMNNIQAAAEEAALAEVVYAD